MASTVHPRHVAPPKDVVRGIFEDLDIKPGDSNVVEAVLQLIKWKVMIPLVTPMARCTRERNTPQVTCFFEVLVLKCSLMF